MPLTPSYQFPVTAPVTTVWIPVNPATVTGASSTALKELLLECQWIYAY